MRFLDEFQGKVLFTTDSAGRREQVYDLLTARKLDIERVDSPGQTSANRRSALALQLRRSRAAYCCLAPRIALISDQQLFGERARQRQRRKRTERDPESIIRR